MAKILKGADVAAAINEKTRKKVAVLGGSGIEPCMAVLRVGDRPDDIAYEKSAVKHCENVGIEVKKVILPQDVTQKRLMQEIETLNNDDAVHGVLMFRPLPRDLDEKAACAALDPEKDIDGITDMSLAGVFTGSGTGFAPCTAQAAMEVLDFYSVKCKGAKAVVLGRSLVIGKPAAMMLLDRNATVTVCHSKTEDLNSTLKAADIIVAAAGKAGIVGAGALREGQTVIDVGINFDENGKMCGDVSPDAEQVTDAYTPVPGGVGTVTTAVLVSHVAAAAEKKLKTAQS